MTKLEASKKLYELCKNYNGGIAEIGQLIKEGADINYSCPGYGYTPLHMAAYFGNKDLIELLLMRGTNPTPYSYNVKTPLDLAIDRHNNKDVIELMRSFDCKKAPNKGIYFLDRIAKRKSFMLDDVCIMVAISGKGAKIYSAKANTPAEVNLYGGDNTPVLIGAITEGGDVILEQSFADLYFPKRSIPYLHEVANDYNLRLRSFVMENFANHHKDKDKAEFIVKSDYLLAKRTALLGWDNISECKLSFEITNATAADILCEKYSFDKYIEQLSKNPHAKYNAGAYVTFVNTCKEMLDNEIKPYEQAIADVLKELPPEREIVVDNTKTTAELMFCGEGFCSWDKIKNITIDGRTVYDAREYEKEDEER